jgi:tagaturonate reductase
MESSCRTVESKLTEKVLQFGGGNFIRAFADWMIDVLNEKTDFNGSVIVVKPRPKGDYKQLRAQNGTFHVALNGIKAGMQYAEINKVNCISRILHAHDEWESLLKSAEQTDLRFVISNTTESGIIFNDKDVFDLKKAPKEYPAKLCIWLYQRFLTFEGAKDRGCVILPLELIADNGKVLKDCVLQYAQLWQLEPAFLDWINQANYFCNTLVDRIVAGFPKEKSEALFKEIGREDALLVEGEYYHNWIIQGPAFLEKELPFSKTDLNVVFADDLDIHRKIKVRLLNGAHTTMVPIGLLCHLPLVSEAMAHPVLGSFIKDLLQKEVIPTIDYPKDALLSFAEAVFDRFSNVAIRHQLIDISLNSTTKFITRLSYTLKDYIALEGVLPNRIVFALAALLRLYKGEIDGKAIPLRDKETSLNFIKTTWEHFNDDYPKLVQTILSNTDIWGQDLTEIPNLCQKTAAYLSQIDKNGMESTLKIYFSTS